MSKPIFSISIIILALGFGIFYVKPEYDTFQTRQNDLVMLGETLQSAGQINSLIDQTNNTLNSIDAGKLSRFAVFLPDTTDSIRLANDIQHLGLIHGILLNKIAVEPTSASAQTNGQGAVSVAPSSQPGIGGQIIAVAKPPYVTTKTTLSFTATSGAFGAFLKDLEKSLGLMNVTSLTFSPASTGSTQKINTPATQQYQYDIGMETYSLK